jgi:hypothetical protein
MQAMSATDGGLTMQEWDKVKLEQTATAATPVLELEQQNEQTIQQNQATSAQEQTAKSVSQPIGATLSLDPVSSNNGSEKVVG